MFNGPGPQGHLVVAVSCRCLRPMATIGSCSVASAFGQVARLEPIFWYRKMGFKMKIPSSVKALAGGVYHYHVQKIANEPIYWMLRPGGAGPALLELLWSFFYEAFWLTGSRARGTSQ